MDKLWYYTQGASQEKKGPVPEAEIKSLAADGQIHATDLLWTDGMANWAPLSTLPQLQSSSPSVATTPATSPDAMFNQMPVPEGLTGWMTFVAVTTIILGALMLLSCNIIVAIPMIIAGSLLLGAKNALSEVSVMDASLFPFFNKLKSFMIASGIIGLINLVTLVFIAILLTLYFSVIMAAIAGKTGAHP